MKILLLFVMIFFCVHGHGDQIKDWTFLVFVNANNNLDAQSAVDINKMEKSGSSEKINVVVQWGSLTTGKSQRLYIEQDADENNITSPVIEDLGYVDMGQVQSLSDFIQWAVRHYPARHYFIDVWGHGTGWRWENEQMHLADISFDAVSGHIITTKELGQAMDQAAQVMGHTVDIYGSDACLMASLEVATQMRHAVDYFVGSEEAEPAEGWPYDAFLKAWNTLPSATPANVAKTLTRVYAESSQQELTFSAYDLSQVQATGPLGAVQILSEALLQLSSLDKLKALQAMQQTQRFSSKDFGDLLDFTYRLEDQKIQSSLLDQALASVQLSLQDYVIANHTTAALARAHGVSIWMPDKATWLQYKNTYESLEFNKMTGWAQALEFLNK